MRTQAQLRVELKNETEALKNVLKTNREQLRWIRWAEKELVRLSKLIDRMTEEAARTKNILTYVADCSPDGKMYLAEANALSVDYCEEQRQEREVLRQQITEAQQEIERLHDQLTEMAERVAEAESIPVAAHNRIVAQTITAMDAERTSFEQEIERLKDDATRFKWLCEDLTAQSDRDTRDILLGRMGVMGYGAICAAIDQALAGTKEGA